MDQFASVMSKESNVILLDCESLDYEYVPFEIKPYKILLLNTNVSHNLASGEYNIRRSQCEKGLEIIKVKPALLRNANPPGRLPENQAKGDLGAASAARPAWRPGSTA